MPPYGYETVFAVGTTYSLDLDALIGASIALGLSESIDNELKDNPIYLLEALQKTADKMLIFCEGGQIKVPSNSNALHILLEKMVVEIVMKNKKSFHPKFWLVKYQNEDGEALYRCLVLSRNLTFDRSWDVAVCIEGYYKDENDKTLPLFDFLQSLTKMARRNEIDSNKRKMLLNLAAEIKGVNFELNEKEFTDFKFCPVGIENYNIENTGLFNTYHELLIISPFLSNGTIKEFNELALTNPNYNTLITRKSELVKLKPSAVTNFETYVMKDIIVDGEDALSEGEEADEIEKQKQDIHAKVYLKTKYSDSELYIGSLNASNSACYGNVEFLFKLYGKKRYLNVDFLKKDLFGDNDKDNPFEIAEIKEAEEPEATVTDNLEKIIKDICRLKSHAYISSDADDYSIDVSFENFNENNEVYISPLLSNKEKKISDHVVFDNLKMLQLSEFYVVRAVSGDDSVKRVIKIKTENMPENRENAIVNNIIKDKNGFIQYISFVLGDDYLLSLLENKNNTKYGFLFGGGEIIPALYEKMLKAAAHSPQKFNDIKKIMDLISDDNLIPDGFKELYEVFEKVVNKK